ncbi:MAG: SDR family oxidoreductase [Candidatus Omnitrophica bacterium]|nr:SDR family oxidoreductase [Candidatus Omnitrophota bacterium]MBI3021835.1 SDR family oxidoreductase [Candidatus Omnitrophota bacterium]
MPTVEERFNLRGKVAAIIGGAGYLCSTLAEAMAEAGISVFILDVAEPVRGNPVPTGTMLPCLRCDVTSKDDLIRCRDQIQREHGRIDILLNGAGTNAPTPFFDISLEEFDRIMRVNLLGTLLSCQVFGEVMVRQRAGSIINFTSVSKDPPLSKAFVYSTAKAGVANLTQNLAREWAPFNVRVNALRPGFFPTAWSMRHFIDEPRKAAILNHTPMGRFGQPEELIGAVLWLASDAASFVTGSIVTVDGGFTAMTI